MSNSGGVRRLQQRLEQLTSACVEHVQRACAAVCARGAAGDAACSSTTLLGVVQKLVRRMQQTALVSAQPQHPHNQDYSAAAPHEFRHAARLVGCLSGLVGSLAPVKGTEQPRPQDRALAEALVDSDVVQAACSMVWRLTPKVHGAPKKKVCPPDSPAWEQTVCISSPAAGNAPAAGISVRAALTKLTYEVLTALLGLNAWLEAAAGAAGADAGSSGNPSSSTPAVHPAAGESVATAAAPDVSATTAATAGQSGAATVPPAAPNSRTGAAASHVQQAGSSGSSSSSSSKVTITPVFAPLLSKLAHHCCQLNTSPSDSPSVACSDSDADSARVLQLLTSFVWGCFKALSPAAGSTGSKKESNATKCQNWQCPPLDFQGLSPDGIRMTAYALLQLLTSALFRAVSSVGSPVDSIEHEDVQVGAYQTTSLLEDLLEDVLDPSHMHTGGGGPALPGAPAGSLLAMSCWGCSAHVLRLQRWLLQVGGSILFPSMPGVQEKLLAAVARSCITVDAAVTRHLSALKHSNQQEVPPDVLAAAAAVMETAVEIGAVTEGEGIELLSHAKTPSMLHPKMLAARVQAARAQGSAGQLPKQLVAMQAGLCMCELPVDDTSSRPLVKAVTDTIRDELLRRAAARTSAWAGAVGIGGNATGGSNSSGSNSSSSHNSGAGIRSAASYHCTVLAWACVAAAKLHGASERAAAGRGGEPVTAGAASEGGAAAGLASAPDHHQQAHGSSSSSSTSMQEINGGRLSEAAGQHQHAYSCFKELLCPLVQLAAATIGEALVPAINGGYTFWQAALRSQLIRARTPYYMAQVLMCVYYDMIHRDPDMLRARATFLLQTQLLAASGSLAADLAQQLGPDLAQPAWPAGTLYAGLYMQSTLLDAAVDHFECLGSALVTYFQLPEHCLSFEAGDAAPGVVRAAAKEALLEMCTAQPFMFPVSVLRSCRGEDHTRNTSSDVFKLLAWVRWMLPAARSLQAVMRAAAPCLTAGELEVNAAVEDALLTMLFIHIYNLPYALAECLDGCLEYDAAAATVADSVSDSCVAMLCGVELGPAISMASMLCSIQPETSEWLVSVLQVAHHIGSGASDASSGNPTQQLGGYTGPGTDAGGTKDRHCVNNSCSSHSGSSEHTDDSDPTADAAPTTTFTERFTAVTASPLLDAILGWAERESVRLVGELAGVAGVEVPGWLQGG